MPLTLPPGGPPMDLDDNKIILPTTEKKRKYLLVIDNSGSMCTNCDKQEEKSTTLTLLDLTIICAKSVIQFLDEKTEIGIISFNDDVKEVSSFTTDKKQLLKSLDTMEACGRTNMHLALDKCLEWTKEENDEYIIFFLTDGAANVGFCGSNLEKYMNIELKKQKSKSLYYFIGFGPDSDDQLLSNLAQSSGGLYSYISDASMMFETFASLTLFSKKLVSIFNIDENNELAKKIWKNSIFFPNIQQIENPFQTKFIQFLIDINESVVYKKIIDTLFPQFKTYISETLQEIEDNKILNAIAKDLDKEISLAIKTKEIYEKWGRRYLKSMLFAHMCQIPLNSRDFLLQTYKSDEDFETFQEMNKIFLKIPVPVKPIVKPNATLSSSSSRMTFSPHSISRMTYGNSSGCFLNTSEIEMDDGTFKSCQDIQMGDILKNGSVVRYIVMNTNYFGDLYYMDQKTALTPYHPILRENWQFPKNVSSFQKTFRNFATVYNFILDSGHIVEFRNGWKAVTLGHGFMDNEIVQHPFFGSEKVIQNLLPLADEQSIIDISFLKEIRDPETGLICGYDKN